MNISLMTVADFRTELRVLHGWSEEAADAFEKATVHWELPRKSWLRIAEEWAIEQEAFGVLPTLYEAPFSYGAALFVNGVQGAIQPMASEQAAHEFVDQLNDEIQAPGELMPAVRWFVVKTSVVLSRGIE